MATNLDEFKLIRPLGRGGMGIVYLAHDTVLDRDVAIKLIADQPDATSRERFVTEARAAARLAHPNIVAVHRVGTTRDGRPYLVQELVTGTSLDQLERPVPWRRAAELGRGIARGIAAAHQRGILHRDLKPANVMLDERGEVRILDFGLAKLVTDEPAVARVRRDHAIDVGAGTVPSDVPGRRDHAIDLAAAGLATNDVPRRAALDPDATAAPQVGRPGHDALEPDGAGLVATPDRSPTPATLAGTLLGTPRYLAPELWRGEPASPRTDMYAIGVLLYELVAGAPPFTANDVFALEAAITSSTPKPIGESATVPPWFAALVDRCLARDADARPRSAAELAHALELGLSGGGAIPEGNPYRGLASFDAAHRGLFFGRGLDASAVLDRLRVQPIVVVAGDSGIGKSSLVHAAIVPAVLGGELDARTWRAVTVVPGRTPFAAIAVALGFDAIESIDALVRDARPDADAGLLVVVDQLEELATISSRRHAERATELLAALAKLPNVRVLATVRGDYLTRIAAFEAFAAPLARGLHLLRPLADADLREAVIGPAREKGVRFESEHTVEALVASVRDTPGALPLLSFTLAELWEARDDARDVIPSDALDRIGGVGGALARHADRVVLGLPAEARAAARRLLLRLVTADDTRAALATGELVDGAPGEAALESLVRGRLVLARDVAGGEPLYELAHEALIRSWSTLRGWIDDQAGSRAVRERIATAAVEWRRDQRRADLLWGPRQLAGTEHVVDLDGGDAEFVAASRRHVRRTRMRRWALVAAVPIVAAATAFVLVQRSHAARDREVALHVATAERLAIDARSNADAATATGRDAFAAFDRGDAATGEATWARARIAQSAARTAFRDTTAELELALAVDEGRSDVREQLGRSLLAHAGFAETIYDRDIAELVRRADIYAAEAARAWHAPAELALDAAPGTRIVVRTIAVRDGRRIASDIVASGSGHVDAKLAAGTYVVELVAPDGLAVRDPIRLERGEHRTLALAPPPRTAVPADMIYIPPGDVLTGSNDDDGMRTGFLVAPPMHLAHTRAYLIGRHEVTFAQWIEFLDALPPAERERRRPATRGSAAHFGELRQVDGVWTVTLQPTSLALRARAGEPLHFPDRKLRADVRWEQTPVFAIDLDDARAYATWLDATGRVPHARLCTELEWERAARGADDRRYPHGDVVVRDDADLDMTYLRAPLAYGPDEVGSHPASDSPFGVADLLGNVWEWVDGGHVAVTRGSSWYHDMASGIVANRDLVDTTLRSLTTGMRVCANAPSAR